MDGGQCPNPSYCGTARCQTTCPQPENVKLNTCPKYAASPMSPHSSLKALSVCLDLALFRTPLARGQHPPAWALAGLTCSGQDVPLPGGKVAAPVPPFCSLRGGLAPLCAPPPSPVSCCLSLPFTMITKTSSQPHQGQQPLRSHQSPPDD